MTKVILFSDLHAHPFKPYSKLLPGGINSRLQDSLDCISQIGEYAVNNDIDTVLFGGDLFHERKHVPTQTLNLVHKELCRMAADGINLYMITGNHDQYDAEGVWDSLSVLRDSAIRVWDVGWHNIPVGDKKLAVLAIPYIEDSERLKTVLDREALGRDPSLPSIFFGHLGLNDAMAQNDFIYRNPVELSIKDLHPECFDAGFIGHFHIHQGLGHGFYYIGAPIQHNWADKGQDRGFIVYDIETKEAHRVLLDTPKFVEVDDISFYDSRDDRSKWENNYVRLVAKETWTDEVREATRLSLGMRFFEVVNPEVSIPSAVPRVELDPADSYYEVVTKCINSGIMDSGDLDKDKLIALGHELIREVEGCDSQS